MYRYYRPCAIYYMNVSFFIKVRETTVITRYKTLLFHTVSNYSSVDFIGYESQLQSRQVMLPCNNATD